VDFNVGSFSTRTEQALGGEIIARLLGFLRPLESWGNDEMLRVCASNADAVLNMSQDAEYGKLVSIFSGCVFQMGDCSENLRSVRKKKWKPYSVQLEAQQVIIIILGQKQVLCVAVVEAVLKNDKAVLNLSVLN